MCIYFDRAICGSVGLSPPISTAPPLPTPLQNPSQLCNYNFLFLVSIVVVYLILPRRGKQRYDQPAAAEDWNSRRRPSGGISGNTGGTSRTQSGSLLGRLPPGSLLPGNTGSLNVSVRLCMCVCAYIPHRGFCSDPEGKCVVGDRVCLLYAARHHGRRGFFLPY